MIDIAVVGAGAISTEGYLPAIRSLSNARLSRIVDVDEERAEAVAKEFDAAGYATDHDSILDAVDLAVVATPPSTHAEISETFLGAGVHVMTEKPVATTSERGRELVALAEETGSHFAISRQLRESPTCRAVKTLFRSRTIGPPSAVEMRVGDQTHWQFASNYRLRPDLAWGGVLPDRAPHALDILLWLFGTNAEVTAYRDDSLGGLEANAEIELTFVEQDIPAYVEVTADRDIENVLRIEGEMGTLTTDPRGGRIRLTESDGETVVLRPEGDAMLERFRPRVARQLERFVDAVADDREAYVHASTSATIVSWIEDCYATRTPLSHPWEEPGIERELEVEVS